MPLSGCFSCPCVQVRAVVAALRIPVISNGNTACHADVAANLAATGAAGVMSGEGVLSNPLLFETTPRGGGEGGGGEGGGGEGGGGEGGGSEGGGGEGGGEGGILSDRTLEVEQLLK